MIFWYVVVGIIGATLLFMFLRAAFTRRPEVLKAGVEPYGVDKDEVARHLSEAVRIPTVTLVDNENGDGKYFIEYREFLEKTYPAVFSIARRTIVNKYSLIYFIEGTDKALLPAGILAHQDVVPADDEGWECPAFGGEIKDNCVYGRGSQDMKSQMIAALEALEILLKDGFKPKRSLYFLFGHDEERKGTEGAVKISEYLDKKGVKLEFVLDEGGTILDGKLLKINNKIALVGTSEKGYADFILEVDKDGGHSSAPSRRTAVGILSEAVYNVEINKLKPAWPKPTKEMIKALAPYVNNFSSKPPL
jgi:Acetylornithine deacetylase/Succinyl-diaminopimelate desuccinylase and related deacylases